MKKSFKTFAIILMVLSFVLMPNIVNAESSQVYEITYKIDDNIYCKKNDNPIYYTKSTDAITLQDPVCEGYTFKGWFSDKKLTKQVKTIKKGKKGDRTLYAKLTKNKYNIKFDANGGTGKMSTIKNVKYDKWNKLPKNKFTKKGMIFVEWNTEPDGSGRSFKNKEEYGYLSPNNKETVTLYAIWGYKLKLNINYKPTDEENSWVKYYYDSYNPNITTPLPELYRDGYVFKGWYSDKKLTKKVTKIKKGTKKTVTLYAKWEEYNSTNKKQALYVAKQLLAETEYSYSKTSLKNNLKDNYGYSDKAVKYAIDNCKADWTKEAKKTVERYLSYDDSEYEYSYGYSKKYLKEVLVDSYKFTAKQADKAIAYAEKTLKVNWKDQALRSAKNYARWNYSESRIVESLTKYDKFTKKEAEYAAKAKNNGVDYNKNALTIALRTEHWSNYSRERLYNTLKKDYGFTKKQVNAAIDKMGIDFKIAAKDEAKEMIKYSENYYTRQRIIDNLKGEYYQFTKAEAKYAADNIGKDWKKININIAKEAYNGYERSKQALIDDIRDYRGLTYTEAKEAVNNSGIDFSKYAARRAQELATYYSDDKIKEYMKEEKFTDSEIEAAIKKIERA